MKLFVANCTKQHQIVFFRVAERAQPMQRTIRSGAQIELFNGTSDHIGAIIAQLEKYGLVRASEVPRAAGFIGMCYQFDKPVDLGMIMRADEHNHGILDQWGAELRKKAAVGNSAIMNKALDGRVTAFNQEVIEDRPRGQKSGLVDQLRVEEEGRPVPQTPPRRRKAA